MAFLWLLWNNCVLLPTELFNNIVNNMAKDNKNTEAAILEAAEREFMEKGFDGARTTSIAAAAGVTHSMLHYYFRTKLTLFERIVDDKFNLITEEMLEAFRPTEGSDILSRVTAAVERHFDFVAANPQLPFFIVRELAGSEDNMTAFKRRAARLTSMLESNIKDDVAQAAKQGRICEADIMTIFVDIVSLNAFSIAAMPLLQPLTGLDREAYLAARKRENVEVIRKRLLHSTQQR